jgi:glycine betaine/proline transport system substrate-binding protein
MTLDDQLPMLAAVDNNGEDLSTVVNGWIDANEAVWKPWVDAATN